MLKKFNKIETVRDFIRIRQGKYEKYREYFDRVRKIVEVITENKEIFFEVALNGFFKNKEDIEKMAIIYREINNEFLEAVKRLEEISFEAYMRRNKKLGIKN